MLHRISFNDSILVTLGEGGGVVCLNILKFMAYFVLMNNFNFF